MVERTMKGKGMVMASGEEWRLKTVFLGVMEEKREYERQRSISVRRGEVVLDGCVGEGVDSGIGGEEEGERKKSSHLVRRGKMEWRERMRSTSCWAWEEERMD